MQPSTIVHTFLGIGGVGQVSGKSIICDIYIYICMYVCSVLALFLSCANMYVCSFLKLFICCATFNYCALLLIRNWWCWTGEWKEHM